MNNSSEIEKIREAIDKSNTVALSGHTSPDGDAIGACCGLAGSLRLLGKTVYVIFEDFAKKFDVIPGVPEIIYTNWETLDIDLFMALDCGDLARLGDRVSLFEKAFNINIDHHISNDNFGMLNFVNPKASSTSEIIFELIDGYYPMNKEIATALYTGIIFDTGCFKHKSTTPRTMEIASKLMEYNIPFTELQETLFYSKSYVETKLMGIALSRAERLWNGGLVYSYITPEEVASCNGTSKDVDSVIAFLKSVQGVHVAVFFYEKASGDIKASMRSDEKVNVSEVAAKFGGGGHVMASGCSFQTSIFDAMEKLLPVVLEKLKQEV